MTSLTVVVPTFNGQRWIENALTSLAGQTLPVSILVIDDGSDDGTADLAARHVARPVVLRQSNKGVAVARNRGLAEAETPWVAFMDQDDLWHRDRAHLLGQAIHETGAMAVATRESNFADPEDKQRLSDVGDGRAEWPSDWVSRTEELALLARPLTGEDRITRIGIAELMGAPMSNTTSVAYDRRAAISAGGCATFARALDDHILNVNMVNVWGDIAVVERPALFYRIHPAATSNSSPMTLPYLTALLALRHGRALPREHQVSPFVEHLLWQLAGERGLTRAEQLALLTLTVSPPARNRWMARWAKRTVRRREQ